MKKIITRLFLTLITTLSCLGMQEPNSNNTNSRDFTSSKKAILSHNIPLLTALIQTDMSTRLCAETLIDISRDTVFHDENREHRPVRGINIKNYCTLAPILIEKCGDLGPAIALITAASDQSLEKVKFILKIYRDQLSQDDLNRAIDSILKTPRRFRFEDGSTSIFLVANPVFLYNDTQSTNNNIALIKLLEKQKATLSPQAASKALRDLGSQAHTGGQKWTNLGIDDPRDIISQNNSGCLQVRRDIARGLIERGAQFDNSNDFCNDTFDACQAPCVQIDLHLVGKPITKGNLLGYTLGCLFCFPCNITAAMRSLRDYCQPENSSFTHTTPSKSAPMGQHNAPEPALLTNN